MHVYVYNYDKSNWQLKRATVKSECLYIILQNLWGLEQIENVGLRYYLTK